MAEDENNGFREFEWAKTEVETRNRYKVLITRVAREAAEIARSQAQGDLGLSQEDAERIAQAVADKLERKLFDIFRGIGLSLEPEDRAVTTGKLLGLFRMQESVAWFSKAVMAAMVTGIVTALGTVFVFIFLKPWK